MAGAKHILAICGSTRNNSANLHVINAIVKLAGSSFEITLYNGLASLPYFNQDVTDAETPESVKLFREAIDKADGVLICTPEYVFSLPGILKNALEWTVSTTVFMDKPTALITASSSGHKAHESLQLIMQTLGVKTNDEMCLLISGVKSQLNEQGEVANEELLSKLSDLTLALNSTIDKH